MTSLRKSRVAYGTEMKHLDVAVLFVLIAFANTQPVQRRCLSSPSRWMGSYREIDYEDGSFHFATISYDAVLEAIRITEIEREPDDRQRFERILEVYLFREQIMYRVDLQTNVCEPPIKLTDPFRPIGVPQDATFYGIDFLGAEVPNLGVRVDQFHHRDEQNGDYHGSFAPASATETVCIPVLESFINRARPPQRSRNVHVQFLNIVPVASFPSTTFAKPSQCQ